MNTQIIVYRKMVGIESEIAYIRIEQTASKVLRCFNLQPIESRSDMRSSPYLFIFLIGNSLCCGVHHPKTVVCAIHFQPHYIDTILIGRLAFAADKEITSYKLEIVASQLGVDLDDAHDAAADVTATLDVLGVYTSRLRNNEGATMTTGQRDKTRKHFKI